MIIKAINGRGLLGAGAALALTLGSAGAALAEYPERPISMIVAASMAEVNLRRGLLINQNDYMFLVERPISLVILLLTVLVLVFPLIRLVRKGRSQPPVMTEAEQTRQ